MVGCMGSSANRVTPMPGRVWKLDKSLDRKPDAKTTHVLCAQVEYAIVPGTLYIGETYVGFKIKHRGKWLLVSKGSARFYPE